LNSNSKKVSVLLASYNHSDYVLKAIDSVLEQNWPNVDLIVIDDGSTDGSPDLLSDFHKKHRGFRLVINSKNKGVVKTLNEGLRIAEGEFICNLGSDDYLAAGSLAIRASYLCEHPECVAVFADGYILCDDMITDQRIMSVKRRRLFEIDDPIPEFLKGVNLPIHTLMTRTALLRDIGGYDERYKKLEDLDVQLRLCLEGPIAFIDVPLYCFRMHNTNTSIVNPYIARADKVRMYDKYLMEIQQLVPYRKMIRYQLRRQYLLLGRYINKTKAPDPVEREIFQGGWKYAYQDIRLLWHLVLCKFRQL